MPIYGGFFLRKLCCLFIGLFCVLVLCGCTKVCEDPSHELVSKVWVCENPSGMKGKLSFEGSFAKFSLYQGEEELCEIYGRYAVDSKKFYIVSEELSRIYYFSYEVYSNRVYISYMENTLEFLSS